MKILKHLHKCRAIIIEYMNFKKCNGTDIHLVHTTMTNMMNIVDPNIDNQILDLLGNDGFHGITSNMWVLLQACYNSLQKQAITDKYKAIVTITK